MTAEYTKLISELAVITETIKTMTERKKAIEAVLLVQGADDLKDTKDKSISYADARGNRLTYTEAVSVSVISPAYLRQLFGEAYDDIINEVPKTDYKIASKALERMFAALYTYFFRAESIYANGLKGVMSHQKKRVRFVTAALSLPKQRKAMRL